MTADGTWEGDINEAVTDEWVAETTPFERVKDVLLATTSYQYAGTIADRAKVSEPSARTHLKTLTATGFAQTDDSGRGTKYKRSRETVAMERIRELHAELSKEALTAGIRDLKATCNDFRAEYEATDPDDLALELAAADSEGWAAVSRWRGVETNLKVAKAALLLYDFDPDGERGTDVASFASTHDAFGSDTESSSV